MADITQGDPEKAVMIQTYYSGNLVYQEHASRYNFVASFVRGKTVLDLGCGIADGTYKLAQTARQVVGLEFDPSRREYAREHFQSNNLCYVAMDGCFLGFASGVFDVVVSLEVIEHIDQHDQFMSELKRVLKPHGVAIISTPNKEIIAMEGTQKNPLHVRELTFLEFKKMMSGFFTNVRFWGQSRGPGIQGQAGCVHAWVRRLDVFRLRTLLPQDRRSAVASGVARRTGAKDYNDITAGDFTISDRNVGRARNIIAVCVND